mmetsp:Transcript_67808/g.123766  ORF Transcript_67808/g.123766 Transcript_67808/m.123766 type:complete len:98 (+) Transcript_67808:201-494(+)
MDPPGFTAFPPPTGSGMDPPTRGNWLAPGGAAPAGRGERSPVEFGWRAPSENRRVGCGLCGTPELTGIVTIRDTPPAVARLVGCGDNPIMTNSFKAD